MYSDSLHTSGVITGFHMLESRGKLTLSFNDFRNGALLGEALIDAVCDGKKIVFDLTDGYLYNNPQAVEKHFKDAYMIFKRSYSKDKNDTLPKELRGKIYPLGLNWFVTYSGNPLTPPSRGINGAIKRIKLTNSYLSDFEAPILKPNTSPKILFLTRLWDPDGKDILGNTELAEERRYINKTRTDAIKILKERFGSSFFGGVYRDAFSETYCPALLVSKAVSLKRFYLKRMKHSDICINTMGLHGSVGWKTAEYVAASRAIVSEKFNCEVPGDFSDGQNYLSFETPEECANLVKKLVDSPEMRVKMSESNNKYYKEYLRPDKQIQRALDIFDKRCADETND